MTYSRSTSVILRGPEDAGEYLGFDDPGISRGEGDAPTGHAIISYDTDNHLFEIKKTDRAQGPMYLIRDDQERAVHPADNRPQEDFDPGQLDVTKKLLTNSYYGIWYEKVSDVFIPLKTHDYLALGLGTVLLFVAFCNPEKFVWAFPAPEPLPR